MWTFLWFIEVGSPQNINNLNRNRKGWFYVRACRL